MTVKDQERTEAEAAPAEEDIVPEPDSEPEQAVETELDLQDDPEASLDEEVDDLDAIEGVEPNVYPADEPEAEVEDSASQPQSGEASAPSVKEALEPAAVHVVQELEYAPASKDAGDDSGVEIRNVAEARAILEALLFTTTEPLTVAKISKLMNNLHHRTVRGLVLELQLEYESRNCALQVVEVAGGFQMATRPHLADWVFRMQKHRKRNPLSPATLETLAIIAYKQPVTKAEIETVRGVESTGPLRTLQELALIEVGGRREVIGRPQLYVTTEQFLKTFGLKSLAELPSIHELKQLFAEDQKLSIKRAEGGALEKSDAAPEEAADLPVPENEEQQSDEKSIAEGTPDSNIGSTDAELDEITDEAMGEEQSTPPSPAEEPGDAPTFDDDDDEVTEPTIEPAPDPEPDTPPLVPPSEEPAQQGA